MEIDQAAFAFSALGQSTRLELLKALLNAGPSGLSAGEVAARLGVPASTLSFHLRALDQAGLIAATRQGTKLIYAPRIDRLRSLLTFVVDSCCGGDPGLCGELGHLAATEGNFRMSPAHFNVLFLCTRNSARSILAEAILNELAPGRFTAFSAGSEPAPEGPMPEVISALQGIGHDVSDLRSKGWEEFMRPDSPKMDFVITLCDTLTGQICPDFGDTPITAAWSMPDPAKFTGNAAQRGLLLKELYAGLRRRLQIFVNLPIASLDRIAMKARLDELANANASVLR